MIWLLRSLTRVAVNDGKFIGLFYTTTILAGSRESIQNDQNLKIYLENISTLTTNWVENNLSLQRAKVLNDFIFHTKILHRESQQQ